MKKRQIDTVYWCLLGLFGVLFFMLNWYTPFQHDDFAYVYYYAQDSDIIRPTSTPVTWGSLIPSMWHHYCYVNGRFTSHLLVQIFCGLLGKTMFNPLNTLIFVLLIHLLVRFSSHRNSIAYLCASVAAIFMFAPAPKQTLLWMTGAINYLWTATFALAIIYYIQYHKTTTDSTLKVVLAFIIGLFVGWMQESITVGVSGALFIWFVFNKKSFVGTKAALAVGLWIGTLCIILGPGTFSRISTGDELVVEADFIQHISSRLLGVSLEFNFIPFAALISSIIILCNRKLRQNLMLPVCLFLCTMIFVYLLGIRETRIYFGLVIFGILLLLCFCNHWLKLQSRFLKYTFIGITLAYSSFEAMSTIGEVKRYSDYTAITALSIEHSDDEAIIEYVPYPIKSKWILNLGMSPDRYDFHNRVRAFYYNKKAIQAFPPGIYSLYEQSLFDTAKLPTEIVATYRNKNYPVFEIPKENIFLIKIQKSLVPDKKLSAIYTKDCDTSVMTSRQRMIRYLLNTLPSKQVQNNTFSLSDNNGSYIIFPKEPDVIKIDLE